MLCNISAQQGDLRDDGLVRIVFADALDESGHVDLIAWAEFIRIQYQLESPQLTSARYEALRKRERELVQDHGKQWLLPGIQVGNLSVDSFHRGFFSDLHIKTSDLIANPKYFETLLTESGFLPFGVILQIEGTEQLRTILAAGSLDQLRSLTLAGHFSAEDVHFILASKFGQGLERLDIMRFATTPYGDQEHGHQFNFSRLTRLRSLSLRMSNWTDSDVAGISSLENLTSLKIGGTLSPQQIARFSNLRSLRSLSIYGLASAVNAEALEALATLPLRELSISHGDIDDAGATAIAKMSDLHTLVIPRNTMTRDGFKQLATLEGTLHHLDVSQNPQAGSESSTAELAKLKNLIRLGMSNTNTGMPGSKNIAKLMKLRHLDISANRIGQGVKEFLKLQDLRTLELGTSEVFDSDTVKELKNLPHKPRVYPEQD